MSGHGRTAGTLAQRFARPAGTQEKAVRRNDLAASSG